MSVNSNSTVTTPAESVPLPRSSERSSKPPVWPIESTEGSQPAPLASKCARHSRADGICCKDLKDDDERTLVDPDIVRDVVIGFSDGITVPFALAAGLSSLGSSRLVVLGGVAELIAGAISMGVGGFLASQAERDYYRFLRVQTAARVGRSCAGEMEREVSEVLAPIGVDDVTCRAVAKDLRDVEGEGQQHARNDTESNISLRWSKDVGLTAFLLKFGEGLGKLKLIILVLHLTSLHRGNSDQTALHLGVDDCTGISVGWSDTSVPILFRRQCTDSPRLLVHRYWICFACLWSSQVTGDRCWPRLFWDILGGSVNTAGWKSRSWRSIRHCTAA